MVEISFFLCPSHDVLVCWCANLVRECAVPGADPDDGDVVEAGSVGHRRWRELAEAGLRHYYRVDLRRNAYSPGCQVVKNVLQNIF